MNYSKFLRLLYQQIAKLFAKTTSKIGSCLIMKKTFVVKCQKYPKPIVEKFLDWIDEKNALAKAADYTLNKANGLKSFLMDGRIEIDNNLTENAIRPSVIGRNY